MGVDWLNSLPSDERHDRAGDVAARWMRQDPEAAARWLENQDDLRGWSLRNLDALGRR